MKVLITGAKGFIGGNLCSAINYIRKDKGSATSLASDQEIYEYDINADPDRLDVFCSDADFIFNLAGTNRPEHQEDFMVGNSGFTSILLNTLRKHRNTCPIMLASSSQAALDNPYGKSKRASEKLLLDYSKETGVEVNIYRFPNVFGKWCRPNYNSVVATFCHNVARNLPILVNDRSTRMQLAYIDDVVHEMMNALIGKANKKDDGFCYVPVTYEKTLGEIADLIYSFSTARGELSISDMSDDFTRKLYATYLSYLPIESIAYPLKMNIDTRGSFTELFRTPERGQLSVNTTKPGIIKGNHWHNTKNEKFIVVSGKGVVRLRRIGEEAVQEYLVSAEKLELIEIPPGYAHSIENTGETDLVTIMWASECFDPEKPDTFYEEV